ncbi:Protein kinase [Coemansia sp. RSA 1933]|nr:Protein kinase [Coemansia sp. RSA 1933]
MIEGEQPYLREISFMASFLIAKYGMPALKCPKKLSCELKAFLAGCLAERRTKELLSHEFLLKNAQALNILTPLLGRSN